VRRPRERRPPQPPVRAEQSNPVLQRPVVVRAAEHHALAAAVLNVRPTVGNEQELDHEHLEDEDTVRGEDEHASRCEDELRDLDDAGSQLPRHVVRGVGGGGVRRGVQRGVACERRLAGVRPSSSGAAGDQRRGIGEEGAEAVRWAERNGARCDLERK